MPWLLHRLANRLLRRPQAGRPRVWHRGERAAADYLKRQGYRILERNFSVPQGEIDLIAFRDGTVVFVEVRTVTEPAHVEPLQTLTSAKRRRLLRAANAYAALHGLDRSGAALRFDAIGVRLDARGAVQTVEHAEAVFWASAKSF